MNIISIKELEPYLTEYIVLCQSEWGNPKSKEELDSYIIEKKDKILNQDKVISILGLLDQDVLIGFISLFKYDGEERVDLTPWYATMYVKEEYRGLGYSKLLNDALLEEARRFNFQKVYLKSHLVHYYEKFGAKYLETLHNGETLYYIDL